MLSEEPGAEWMFANTLLVSDGIEDPAALHTLVVKFASGYSRGL